MTLTPNSTYENLMSFWDQETLLMSLNWCLALRTTYEYFGVVLSKVATT